MNISDIIFKEIPGNQGSLGLITLNRPQALNALNHQMFLALDRQLSEWAVTDSIKAVVIRAVEGRAFCAGGDIRFAYEHRFVKDFSLPDFFRDEYRLNSRIFHFPKPYIALLDGIIMGGGAGISVHGSHRVATERCVFAMPETSIGFFPDVGGSFFLSRLPKNIGFYLGLTGARLTYQDCFALGVVTQVIARESQMDLIHALAMTPFSADAKVSVTEIIERFMLVAPPSALLQYQHDIETCFAKKSMEEIIDALQHHHTWCQQTAALLKTKSPTSLKVTLREIEKGAKLNFDACMQMEFRLTNHFLQAHDFFEGVRAAIIDKDQAPCWQPSRLEEVSDHSVEKYFSPLQTEKDFLFSTNIF